LAYVFLVDLSGDTDYLELTKASILAALEAISPQAWVGLAVFSDRLGLYDLRSAIPHVRYARMPKSGPITLPLEDLLPLDEFLVQLGADDEGAKENIITAVESLNPLTGDGSREFEEHDDMHRFTPAVVTLPDEKHERPVPGSVEQHKNYANPLSSEDGATMSKSESDAERKCGFGGAVQALTDYLRSAEYKVMARVESFIAGLPNIGIGSLHDRYMGSTSEPGNASALLQPQTNFYRQVAETAARAGVCFDLFVVSELMYADLATLKYLTLITGGNLLLYDRADEATLPQDIYRQLRRPQAFGGLLRLRTTSDFQVTTVYGHAVPDETYENLFHIAGCDMRKTLAMDLEFTTSTGFPSYGDRKPIVQLAFSYTSLERTPSGIDMPVKRLRVLTLKHHASRKVADIFDSVHADVLIGLMTQQIIQVTLQQDVSEARSLLQQWLINLMVSYHMHVVKIRRKAGLMEQIPAPEALDPLFDNAPALQFVPRFVFAMLKNGLLTTDVVHPDVRIYLQCLYSGLEPQYLAKALYPTLTSYSDLNTLSKRSLFLSKTAVEETGDHVFLMDAFTSLYVFYDKHMSDLQLPPPHESKLRQTVSRIKSSTPLVTPRLVYCRADTPQERFFLVRLIEETDNAGFSFADFIHAIAKESIDTVKDEMGQQQQ
jgi:Sec23/Sec24 trunk domain/Sec23/Sec24 helical domain